MFYALDENKIRIEPSPGLRATCPTCDSAVIAKCGQIVAWHWAHAIGGDCDSFSEGETKWHLWWKGQALPERCEVRMSGPDGDHRADVVGAGGIVVELQNSPISVEEIQEREHFYGNMIWLFNGDRFLKTLDVRGDDPDFVTFRWKHPPKSLWRIENPLYIDVANDRILHVKKLYDKIPCGGWGKILTYREFLNEFFGEYRRFIECPDDEDDDE